MKRKVIVSIGTSLLALAVLLMALPSSLPSAIARPLAAQSLSVPYLQNFDSLTNTGIVSWTDDATLPGWYAAQSTGVLTTYRASTGSTVQRVRYTVMAPPVRPSARSALWPLARPYRSLTVCAFTTTPASMSAASSSPTPANSGAL